MAISYKKDNDNRKDNKDRKNKEGSNKDHKCQDSTDTRIICLCDDRSFIKNISELETYIMYNLPVKIIILNNKGDSYIRKTQESYFGSRFIGSDIKEDNTLNFSKICEVYNIPYNKIKKSEEINKVLGKILSDNCLNICEIEIDKDQKITPLMVFAIKSDGNWVSKPLEEMYPFLDRKKLSEDMYIDLLDEDN